MDVCPSWDFSYSYYDWLCWSKPTTSKTIKTYNISDEKKSMSEWFKKKQQVESKKASIKKSNISWYEIVEITNYEVSDIVKNISTKIIVDKSLTKQEKETLTKRLNEYLLARYNLESSLEKTQDLKNKYTKQVILLNTLLKKSYSK